MQQLAGNIARLHGRENQYIGRLAQMAERVTVENGSIDGCIGLHLTIDLQIRVIPVQNFNGFGDFTGTDVSAAAKIGE